MMIKCQQCEATIEVNEAVSNDLKYTCKKHNPEPEEHQAGIANYQFDPRLRGSYYKAPVGYQIVSPDQEEILTPEWVKSNSAVQQLLLTAFPRMATNDLQLFRASRWAAVIYLFWRLRYSTGDIANELFLTYAEVEDILDRIRRVSGGMKANGTGPRRKKIKFNLN